MRPALIVLTGDLRHGVPGLAEDPEVGDALLAATLDLGRQVGGVGRVLLFHPPDLEPDLTSKALGFRLWPADGDTPGRRFANAFRQAGELGYEGAVVIGLDVPQLPAERLSEVAELLGEHQAVLIPDGSGARIVALALQRDEPHLFPDGELPDVEALRTRARQQRIRLHELTPHEPLTPDRLPAYLSAGD